MCSFEDFLGHGFGDSDGNADKPMQVVHVHVCIIIMSTDVTIQCRHSEGMPVSIIGWVCTIQIITGWDGDLLDLWAIYSLICEECKCLWYLTHAFFSLSLSLSLSLL
ncbi:hypothetical protein AMTRI_Chr02g211550 [Amborella trichopoda]